MRFLVPALAAGLVGCVCPAAAQTTAEPPEAPLFPGVAAGPPEVPRWRATVGPAAVHYSFSSEHRPVVLFGMERERPDGIVWGGAVFSNSFGQASAYVFGGQRLYGWSRWQPLFAMWSAGLLYGYRGEYEHKVPLNYQGFSPGIVAGVGWQITRELSGQINVLGTSGLMLLFSVDLP